MSYVAKYVAKPTSEAQEGDDSGFNLEPYLHAGRVWGCINKDNLPYAELIEATVDMHPECFLALREVARQFYPGMNDDYPYCGFTLFMASPSDFSQAIWQIPEMQDAEPSY